MRKIDSVYDAIFEAMLIPVGSDLHIDFDKEIRKLARKVANKLEKKGWVYSGKKRKKT